jgi:hypothetical protein
MCIHHQPCKPFVVVLLWMLTFSNVAARAPEPIYPVNNPAAVYKGMTLLSNLGGRPESVAVRQGFAYFTSGLNLEIIDISDSTKPWQRGTITFPNYPLAVTLSDQYAYITFETGGLRIVDITNPSAPVEVGHVNVLARYVVVRANYAYISLTDGGLVILDVSNPFTPSIVSSLAGTGANFTGYALALVNNYLYLGSASSGLRIIDVANVAAPWQVGTYLEGEITGVTISGSLAFIASPQSGLWVANISNSTNPSTLGNLPIPIQDVVTDGRFVYASHYYGDFMLRVISVANPSQPRELAAMKTYATTVAVDGVSLYIPHPFEGLQIMDMSDPSVPRLRSTLPQYDVFAAATQGTYAYLATSKGVRIVNITDPAHPIEVGSFSNNRAVQIIVANNLVYASFDLTTPVYHRETVILDVSLPSEPREVGSIAEGGRLAISSNYLYIADRGWAGLHVIDVRDPAKATEVAQISGYAGDIEVAGHYAYVAGDGGVRIFDVADPVHPVEVAVFAGYTFDIDLRGAYLYIGSPGDLLHSSGLYVVDITDPTHPTQAGFLPGYAWDIAVDNHYAYYNTWQGITVVDITDPANLRLAGSSYNPSAAIADIYSDGNLVLVSAGGLAILRGTGLSITGRVSDASGRPYINAKIVLENGRQISLNATGAFEVDGLTVGTYTIRPVSTSVQFVPSSQTITVALNDSETSFVSFTAMRRLYLPMMHI